MSMSDEFEDRVHCRGDLDTDREAREHLRLCALRRLETDPHDRDALMALGDVCVAVGRYDEARLQYLRVVTQNPRYAPALAACGAEYIRKKDFAQAAEFFRKAIAERPANAFLTHSLGVCLLNMGRRDEAVDCFKKAIQLNERYAPSYFMLAGIYGREGDHELARQYVIHAIDFAYQAGNRKLMDDALVMMHDITRRLDKPAAPSPEAPHQDL